MINTEEKLQLPAEADGSAWLHRKSGAGPLHRHAELEINICVAGSAVYLVDNKRFHLSRRTALWLFPAQEHVLLERSEDFAMWIAVWKPALLQRVCRTARSEPLCALCPDETWIARLENNDLAMLESLCAEIAASDDQSHHNAGFAWLLMQCLAAWNRSSQPVAGRAVHPAIERAARLLKEENLDVSELARRVGLSPSRLSRVFHQEIGQTLTDFRSHAAIERFMTLYDGRTCSLLEAAGRAGFGSYAQFGRALRAHTGQSPAQYRASLRKRANSTVPLA
ncbi:MAG TPA: AraC family transcriptional regulator [Abditibacteriaceae bacterium]